MLRFGVTIFISAFLLFAVQPLIGKFILPWYGGGPGVWTACLLFFQVMLLAGYAYAHFACSRLHLKTQVIIHVGFVVLTLALLPIAPMPAVWKLEPGAAPMWRILLLLLVNIGGPFLALGSSGPLMQRWFSRTNSGRSPYRLYALANFGSLLALVSYPFIVEPMLSVDDQAMIWSCSYAGFAALTVVCAWPVWKINPLSKTTALPRTLSDRLDEAQYANSGTPNGASMAMWLGLAACSAALLIATTNELCQELAVVPFLWVLPLSLYLLSFVICFSSRRCYHRGVFGVLLIAMVSITCLVLYRVSEFEFPFQIAVFGGMLFAACMTCHGELFRSRPAPQYLTLFYLMVSAGGALGGVAVALLAPVVFTDYWEYHLSVAAACILTVIAWNRAGAWPKWLPDRILLQAPLAAALVALVVALFYHASIAHDAPGMVDAKRSFHGVLHVIDGVDEHRRQYRAFLHGHIMHGQQYLDPALRRAPTAYFGPNSGVGLAMRHHPRRINEDPDDRHLHVGVIGLGTGMLVAHGQPGDRFRFYEINPQVINVANEHFTYLSDSSLPAAIERGDGRVQLERELRDPDIGSQQFDVLIVDAFHAGAMPIHLLTAECADLYEAHLKPDGLLLLNISNRHVDLYPVVRGLGDHLGLSTISISTDDNSSAALFSVHWVVLTRNARFLEHEAIIEAAAREDGQRPPLLWTDDFATLWQVIQTPVGGN